MGFSKATFYLTELFRQATFYLAELFRQATFHLAVLYLFWENFDFSIIIKVKVSQFSFQFSLASFIQFKANILLAEQGMKSSAKHLKQV